MAYVLALLVWSLATGTAVSDALRTGVTIGSGHKRATNPWRFWLSIAALTSGSLSFIALAILIVVRALAGRTLPHPWLGLLLALAALPHFAWNRPGHYRRWRQQVAQEDRVERQNHDAPR